MNFKYLTTILLSILTFSLYAQKKVKLKTTEDSVAYSLGLNIAKDLKRAQLDTILPPEFIIAGLTHSFSEKTDLLISEDDALKMISNYFERLNELKKDNEKNEAEKTKKIGKTFLENNKQDKSIIVTESGLQYKIIKQGNGPKPTESSKVKVHYKGTLIDGTVFDSSYDRGEPVEFGVTQVIKGWTEALLLMPVGSKWKVFIPYDLAYGERSAGNHIKPFSTLIFEIELLDIVN